VDSMHKKKKQIG